MDYPQVLRTTHKSLMRRVPLTAISRVMMNQEKSVLPL